MPSEQDAQSLTGDEVGWTDVAGAEHLRDVGRCLVRHPGHEVAVFASGGKLFAVSDSCPHSGASLCSGQIDAGHVRCPAHGLRFRLSDGRMAGLPSDADPGGMALRVYAVRWVGARLQMKF